MCCQDVYTPFGRLLLARHKTVISIDPCTKITPALLTSPTGSFMCRRKPNPQALGDKHSLGFHLMSTSDHDLLFQPGVYCSIRYPFETYLKSREISYVPNSHQIVWNFPRSTTLSCSVENSKRFDLKIQTKLLDERDFARFDFKMVLGRICYIAIAPGSIPPLEIFSSYFRF